MDNCALPICTSTSFYQPEMQQRTSFGSLLASFRWCPSWGCRGVVGDNNRKNYAGVIFLRGPVTGGSESEFLSFGDTISEGFDFFVRRAFEKAT